MIPECVGRWVHEEKASMSELQLHRFNLSAALFSTSVPVPEDEVSCRPQRDRGDGAKGVQFSLIVTMLAHVILPIFVPGAAEKNTLRAGTLKSPGSFMNEHSVVPHLLIKTKLNVCPVVFVTASRMNSNVGVHGQAKRFTLE